MAGKRKPAPEPQDAPGHAIERVVPHDLDAERAVLAGILIDNRRIDDALMAMRPADMFRDPHRRVLLAMPVILFGLALALDVLGAASGLGAGAHWGRIGAGVAFAQGGNPWNHMGGYGWQALRRRDNYSHIQGH